MFVTLSTTKPMWLKIKEGKVGILDLYIKSKAFYSGEIHGFRGIDSRDVELQPGSTDGLT